MCQICFFFGGGEWGCREFGRWWDRSYFFWTFSGSHFARNMSSDGAEKQLTAEVTISYCVKLWVDRYVIQWQLRIMNNNKIIKHGIQYFDIHFMLIDNHHTNLIFKTTKAIKSIIFVQKKWQFSSAPFHESSYCFFVTVNSRYVVDLGLVAKEILKSWKQQPLLLTAGSVLIALAMAFLWGSPRTLVIREGNFSLGNEDMHGTYWNMLIWYVLHVHSTYDESMQH